MAESLSASLEDYLEAIFHIVSEKRVARAKDISKRMHVNRSSVTGAMHSLAKKKLVNYAPYDLVTLTPRGRAVAADVVRRHEVLRDFLMNVLAVEADRADAAACEIEHHVDNVVLRRLSYLAEFIRQCPHADSDAWLANFREFCSRREDALLADLVSNGKILEAAARQAELRDE